MRILGLDTALGACSAAVLEDDHVLARAHETMPRGHAEALAPMAERVMREAGCAFSSLDRIAVTTGPGTFTGQRVGLAFARAMALALKIPAIGVTTLDAMAAEALAEGDAGWAAAAIDAKRGEIYLGARARNGETLIEAVLAPLAGAAEAIAELASKIGRDLVLAGTGAEALRTLLQATGLAPRLGGVRQPDAVFAARLAMHAEAPGHPPRPLYLRGPDAKLPPAHA